MHAGGSGRRTGRRRCRSRACLPRALLGLALAVVGAAPSALEFRTSIPVRTPDNVGEAFLEGAVEACVPEPCGELLAVQLFEPVRRSAVRAAIDQVAAAWNSAQLREYLADGFFDRNRLLDTFSEVVPRDARLKVLSVQSVEVLAQYLEDAAPGEPALRVSVVTTRVRTQVEFTDPRAGFVRSRAAAQEYILVLTERAND